MGLTAKLAQTGEGIKDLGVGVGLLAGVVVVGYVGYKAYRFAGAISRGVSAAGDAVSKTVKALPNHGDPAVLGVPVDPWGGGVISKPGTVNGAPYPGTLGTREYRALPYDLSP